ncbi:protein DDI1 homolog 2-like isoform X1 [Amphibalanus amphitrite]|uniref:protein DDI1 homolog 2-like isoform X1 n=1 Tax=Amphibalanus amphitrite TaxID=1232801 RepID=UPI001C9146AB|nr:protein DDI1 homolog 2-like isoform X1 [Amphibalanus amphitrite]XP_043206389.1 protein DDI1 homolog 2-like isoform X1 [Amphibalanus amphitrite]XP_043206390.1 protein DDI1 homolog 2-like isoform X1 [Amphibalanus amphitrite]XP_043206391.1 protein DDI1 homolog 2-like isoform X1 [Amphibalanus amphitrite]XP_043206392.1 protein DDI1 homolog 2-like isoform X1 [Amphibalanus amphitrite]XP_043206393.1 protein DDI1 homolog 2-like isoform X1 [Amphibalanus amphitrite]XP_043206394.1 protein DDI1 homolog
MRLTVTTVSGELYQLDVSDDLELENLRAFVQVETGISSDQMILLHDGRRLTDDKKSLRDTGIKEDDVLLVEALQPPAAPPVQPQTGGGSGATAAQQDDPRFIRDMFLANRDQLALLKQNNPRLADALLSNDLERFTAVLNEQQKARADRERMRMRMLSADPFDAEAQRLIAEEIRQKNIDANMEAALEHHPESFGSVVMLYINCRVNGHPVKAFIDSGAQTTIMSAACAERCHIMRLVDTRWSGVAKGVGTQRILGRVHMGQIQIEDVFLTSSFSILEEQPMDMLLGLDMLKRHQCLIDLKANVLHIGTTSTSTPFLSESDLPPCARLSGGTESAGEPMETADAEMARALRESAAAASAAASGAAGPSAPTPAAAPAPPSAAAAAAPAAPAPAAAAATGAGDQLTPTDKFSEADVASIVKLGFTRQQVVQELRRFNGDTTQATGALLARSLQLPKP